MDLSQTITVEEHFAYLVSSGKSKSEAYRTVFPEHKGLSTLYYRYEGLEVL